MTRAGTKTILCSSRRSPSRRGSTVRQSRSPGRPSGTAARGRSVQRRPLPRQQLRSFSLRLPPRPMNNKRCHRSCARPNPHRRFRRERQSVPVRSDASRGAAVRASDDRIERAPRAEPAWRQHGPTLFGARVQLELLPWLPLQESRSRRCARGRRCPLVDRPPGSRTSSSESTTNERRCSEYT